MLNDLNQQEIPKLDISMKKQQKNQITERGVQFS